MANKILDLLDEKIVFELFQKNVLPVYEKYERLDEKIEIKPKKKLIWTDTYHVVFEYVCTFYEKSGESKKISIFCTAHDNEPRQIVYDHLKILIESNFAKDELVSPLPLFYNEKYNATFYQGVEGKTLYEFIKLNNKEKINQYIAGTANWFARLHSLNLGDRQNEIKIQTIKEVVPGKERIMEQISIHHPHLLDIYEKIYQELEKRENKFFTNKENIRTIHGDAHSENVIITDKEHIAVIDFADMCQSDFARDLGSFMQQLEFKLIKVTQDRIYAEKMKNLFLDSYLQSAHIELTPDLINRIGTYFCFTQIRTSTFFLVKHDPQPDRSIGLIKEVIKNLDLNINLNNYAN